MRAPDVPLTVDHVIPEALGGPDEPSNLVTACQPCNAGKTSIAPDSAIVDDVAEDALRWARAMNTAQQIYRMDRELIQDQIDAFDELWKVWGWDVEVTLPRDTGISLFDKWDEIAGSLSRWVEPIEVTDEHLVIRMTKSNKRMLRATTKREMAARAERYINQSVVDVVIAEGDPVPLPPLETRTERHHLPRPADWQNSIERFLALGLEVEDLDRMIRITAVKQNIKNQEYWQYFCGCCWRTLSNLQEEARRIAEQPDPEPCGCGQIHEREF